MLVYRIESVDGIGLYRVSQHVAWEMQETPRHPLPTEDAELSDFWNSTSDCDRNGLRFAFASIDQLKSWVYKEHWRESIADAGLVISVYSARFVRVGATQAVFRLSTSKKIGCIDILNLADPMRKVHTVVATKPENENV